MTAQALSFEPSERDPLFMVCFEPCCDWDQGSAEQRADIVGSLLSRLNPVGSPMPGRLMAKAIRLLQREDEWPLFGLLTAWAVGAGYDVWDGDARWAAYEVTRDLSGVAS